MISVIVPSWNGRDLLPDCLDSLRRQTWEDREVLVVDNGSTDGSLELLARDYPEVRVVPLPENRGFTGAANEGLRAARGDRIALLNNDAEADSDWLAALNARMDSDERCGLAASLMVWHSDPELIDSAGDGFTIAGFGYKRGYRRRVGPPFDQPGEVFSACGGAALIRRALLDEVGLFEEEYFAFGEDLELAFRARLAGWRVLYEPRARVLHRVRSTATPAQALRLGYRNLYTLLIQDLPGPLWLLYGPHILAHTLLVLAGYLVKGQGRAVYGGLRDALARLPATLRRRREVQRLRRAPLGELRRAMDSNWVGIMLELSSTWRRLGSAEARHERS